VTKKTDKVQEKSVGKSMISVDEIWADDNLRDPGWEKSVTELKVSIQEKGLLQPIGILTKASPGKGSKPYKVIFGHRRLAAIRLLGQKVIAAQVYNKMSEQEEFAIRLSENADRLNLEPLEEAKAFAQAIEKKLFTVNELAKAIHKTAGYISQRVGLLKLGDDVKDALEAGRINITHARELCRITDDKLQKKLLAKAEKTDIDSFRKLIADAGEGKVKNTGKGRPKKNKGPENIMKPRQWDDVNKTLSELNRRQLQAKQHEERMKSEYLKGLMRGITWALQMGGADQLLEVEEATNTVDKPATKTKSKPVISVLSGPFACQTKDETPEVQPETTCVDPNNIQ